MSSISATPAAAKTRRKSGAARGPKKASESTVKSVNLALQGGGAHGAFTWGVLDLLLEDQRIAIEGISGTSAGAMNAAVLACGLAEGGRDAARAKLEDFWHQVSELGRLSPLQAAPWDRAAGNWNMDHSPTYLWDSASWEISEALLPYLEAVMTGPEAWVGDATLDHAIEIRDGVVQNQKILSFQRRSPEYPHEAM